MPKTLFGVGSPLSMARVLHTAREIDEDKGLAPGVTVEARLVLCVPRSGGYQNQIGEKLAGNVHLLPFTQLGSTILSRPPTNTHNMEPLH